MSIKVKKIKTKLIGQTLPFSDNSKNARYCERFLINEGWSIDQNAKGPDVKKDNLVLEFKLKDIESESAFTIGKITFDALKNISYNKSHIKEKLQQLCIIEHKDKVVLNANVYDLSDSFIQGLLEEAFDEARELIVDGYASNYIPGNRFGYFERTDKHPNIYAFRIRKNIMNTTIKAMSRSSDNFNKHFEIVD